MGVVNPPQVTPVVMRALCRYFAYRGPDHRIASRDLEHILEPPGATQPGEDHPRPVRATVTEAVALGLLDEDGNGAEAVLRSAIALPDAPLDSFEHERQLAALLRNAILSERNTSGLFAHVGGSEDGPGAGSVEGRALDTTRGREFARMASWLLLQDPAGRGLAYGVMRTHPDEDVETRQRSQCTVPLVVNDARWASFRRWARYLGLARVGLHGRLIPDPTSAVADVLPTIMSRASDLPVDTFLERLAVQIPVLDGGRCHTEVLEQAIKADPRLTAPGDRPVSPVLAFALLRLGKRGVIRLDDRADAPSHRDVAGRVVTHVSGIEQ